jgi:hypothetical protein
VSVGSFSKGFGGPRKEVYVSVWVKIDPNWDGHPSTINKMFFLWMNGGPNWITIAKGARDAKLWAMIGLQGTPDARKHFFQNVPEGNGILPRGRWMRWELVVKMNTPGNSDGEMHWWIDGKKTHQYTDVMFSRAGEPSVTTDLTAASVWGGTGQTLKHEQRLYWDHLYVSGR